MRELGLKGRSARLYHRKVNLRAFYSAIPNRSVGVEPSGPDELWRGDITYLKVGSRWLYLAVVMDMFSRRIVGWSLSHRKDMALTLAAFNRAVANRQPEPGLIFHTDRGIEYDAYASRERLTQLGIVQHEPAPADDRQLGDGIVLPFNEVGRGTRQEVRHHPFHRTVRQELHSVL